MNNWPCRYCGRLKDISKPREKYIGKCELNLNPETCGKFELAKCYEGHDPREYESLIYELHTALKLAMVVISQHYPENEHCCEHKIKAIKDALDKVKVRG
jgi:hypothetical protein